MNEKNDVALVRRPPSAVEKLQPGAKRILSDMVKEALSVAHHKLDATPLTLSIEGNDGKTIVVFKRNTIIPARTSLIVSHSSGNGTNIELTVVQGEKLLAAKNALVGKFIIDDISPSAEAEPGVKVIFDIDAYGVLHVSAQDRHTGKQQNVRIETKGEGLSRNEIERLLDHAEDSET